MWATWYSWLSRSWPERSDRCIWRTGTNPALGFHARFHDIRRAIGDCFAAGAYLILNGHEHNYERPAPRPTGRAVAM
jgi:hypothetical protein